MVSELLPGRDEEAHQYSVERVVRSKNFEGKNMSIKSNGGRGVLPDHIGISNGYPDVHPGRSAEKPKRNREAGDEEELIAAYKAAGFVVEEDHGDRPGITGARKF